MTEERSCGTCGHYVSDKCVRPGGCCFHHSKWQPIAQEKPMEKIQMTEEQAMCLYRMAGDGHVEFIKRLKQAGYIRKSAWEEAEEMYKGLRYDESYDQNYLYLIMNKLYEAIQELKSEIARPKK
jgi:hypothetical protein